MSVKRIPADVRDWTPLITSLVEEMGLVTAAVFGRVWLYCQEEHGECVASQENIAKDLGLGLRTVRDHLKRLVGEGYLEAEERPGRSTRYRDTGKAGLRFSFDTTLGYYPEIARTINPAEDLVDCSNNGPGGGFLR